MSTVHPPTAPAVSIDPRVAAFCSSRTPEIFRPVAYPTEVWSPDPFDVETIHEEARDVFGRLLDRATVPDGASKKVGRVLLLKGESGSGKTHLMRAFRTHTHRRGAGYFGYMQMTSASGNYARYMLHKLIDSLDKPYYRAPDNADETTGLLRLSGAVVESDRIDAEDLCWLREDGRDDGNLLTDADRLTLVDDLADKLLTDRRFGGDEELLDLFRAMLLLQSGQAGVRARVMKYLRGESLSDPDRKRLGGISPLDSEDGPQEMLCRLGRLMWSTHGQALVLCVDQLEDAYRSDQSVEAANRFRRAMQGLIAVAAQVPTSIMVIACLEDYYAELRDLLDRPHRDRIEQDPSPVVLVGNRSRDEITELVASHLRHLYDETDVEFRESDPTFPIPAQLLDTEAGERTRSVLEACRTFRQECITAGRLIDSGNAKPPIGPPPIIGDESDLLDLEQTWNDFLATELPAPPESEDGLAKLLSDAVHFCESELHGHYHFDTDQSGRLVQVVQNGGGDAGGRLQIGVCNKSAKGGGLGRQVTEVSERAEELEPAAVPVIVRSTEFPKTPAAQVSIQLGKLVARGGRRVVVQDTDWRTMLGMREFVRTHEGDPQLPAWLRQSRPLSRLESLQDILGLTSLPPWPAKAVDANEQPTLDDKFGSDIGIVVDTPNADDPAPSAVTPHPAAVESAELSLGHVRSRAGEPVTIHPNLLPSHSAFIGGTGSGKTTAALNLVEQLLIRGVPAMLVDRKGDLARYACRDIWDQPPADASLGDRQRALRERVEVALYTPGHSDGRPITLPVAPDRMHEMNSAERQQTAMQAAHSLGAMMGYGLTGTNASKRAILVKAIEMLALDGGRITLDALIAYIHEQDPALINAIGVLKPALFNKLVEDLQTLKINRAHLFPEQGDPLDAEALFGLGPHRRPGKTRLCIVSTKFLGGIDAVRFWVAQLLLELSRWSSKSPHDSLQAVVMFDEADLYLPATSKPATKEPMEGLLKRARSAGLGVMLATQSPGDFDYKCKENVNTWLIGKIKEEPAIKKLKPMLSEYRQDVSGKLASQQIGEFFLCREGEVLPVQSGRSVVETRQLPEHEILELARRRS